MSSQAYCKNIAQVIKSELEKAGSNIRVAVAWLTHDVIIETLATKVKQGVLVEILFLDDEINKYSSIENHDVISKHSVIYRIDPQKTMMHNKFCIIDNETVITGSYNWTNKAQTNLENIVVITAQPRVIKDYIEEFNNLKNYCNEIISAKKGEDIFDYKVLLNLARKKVEQNLLIEASKDYLWLKEKFPQKEEIYKELISTQTQLNNFLGIIETLGEYLNNFPENYWLHSQRAELFENLKLYDDSEREINFQLSKCPKDFFLNEKRADLKSKQVFVFHGTLERDYDFYKTQNPVKAKEDRDKYLLLFNLALKDYHHALTKISDTFYRNHIYKKIYAIMFKLGNFEEAAKGLNKIFDSSKDIDSLRLLGKLYSSVNMFLPATKCYKRALESIKKDDFGYFSLHTEYKVAKSQAGFFGNFI